MYMELWEMIFLAVLLRILIFAVIAIPACIGNRHYCPACGSRLESATIGVTTCGRCGTKFRVIMY